MTMEQLTYMELFAGAGGLAEGFIRAGFKPIAHIEMDKYAALTLKTRLAYHYLIQNEKIDIYRRYLKGKIGREKLYSNVPEPLISSVLNIEIREDNLPDIFEYIHGQMRKTGVRKINVIAGGPPCQAYSLIGRARDPYRMEKDKRNYLYRLYVKFLRKFKPDVFVFENVPGLLSAGNGKLWKDVLRYFKNAGYIVEWKLLDARDSGVLQNRKRIFVIGWRKDLDLKYPDLKREDISTYRVADLLDDLPPLQPGERIYVGEYHGPPSEYLLKYGIRTMNDILTLHIARRHNGRDREIYRFYIEKWMNEKRRPEYNELPEHLKTHRNRNSFKDRFKVVAPDLSYSQTIMAHLAKDGHYFIHPDINQLRSISVRETARLQSFPDNYYFEGPMTAMFRQIGNAVPPLIAESIANKIMGMIK